MTLKHGDVEGYEAAIILPELAFLSQNSEPIPRSVMARILWLPNLRNFAKSADKNSLGGVGQGRKQKS